MKKTILLGMASAVLLAAIATYADEGSTYLQQTKTTYNPGCFSQFGASCGSDTTDTFGCKGPGSIGCTPYTYTHPHQTGQCIPDPSGTGGGDNGGGYACNA